MRFERHGGRRTVLGVLLVLAAVGQVSPVRAQSAAGAQTAPPAAELMGVVEMTILVELSDVLKPALSVEYLTTSLGLRLRQAGFTVRPWASDSSAPNLYLVLNALQVNGEYVYGADLEFRRPGVVQLLRGSQQRLVPVWSRRTVGITPDPRSIQDYIGDRAAELLSDLLKANPR